MRKNPVQQRSNATVTRILNAASRIIESDGLDKLTTTSIADGAKLSSGAMYRYFQNKESVLYSLAECRWQEFREIHEECAPEKFESWIDWQNTLVDKVAQKYVSEPGLAIYIDVIATLPEIRELYADYNNRVYAYLRRAYTRFNSRMRKKDQFILSELSNSIITAVLARSVQLPKADQIILQARLKSILYVLAMPYIDQ